MEIFLALLHCGWEPSTAEKALLRADCKWSS
ncbi:hypothetical protein T4D_9223 [Trichinella pseudospiralis]|uniref:Uncharacterized protein n=1 Tax=Trichinella pseudospiralis TaxID=6337 RepID=A0A0V1DPU4_TRIPS|nr:hypothetical protein T4D_9223 [Trichinella pseudospiralis]